MATQSFGDFTCYYRGPFFGRDAGSSQRTNRDGNTITYSWKPVSGLTQWVADNFEVLGVGTKPPTEDRKVDSSNRPSWTPFVDAYLERLFSGSSNRRYVLRRSIEFRQKNQWELFPHPDEAKQLDLVGMKGEIPISVVSIDVNPKNSEDQRLILKPFISKSFKRSIRMILNSKEAYP